MGYKLAVLGAGIQGLTLCKLLAKNPGHELTLFDPGKDRIRPPWVLNRASFNLLFQLWQPFPLAFEHLGLKGPVLKWGNEPAKVLEQPSAAVFPHILLPYLKSQLDHLNNVSFSDIEPADLHEFDWVIDARGRQPRPDPNTGGIGRHSANDAVAYGFFHGLKNEAAHRYLIESVGEAWCFSTPCSGGVRYTQIVLSAAHQAQWQKHLPDILQKLGLLTNRPRFEATKVKSFPCAPAISWPLFDQNYVLAGDAAMALDPIAGDGVGNNLRQSVLLSAIFNQKDTASIRQELSHYAYRLGGSFREHIRNRQSLLQQAHDRSPSFEAYMASLALPDNFYQTVDGGAKYQLVEDALVAL